MKERPILFSAPMVRAILDGRKTQTRRVVKHALTPWNPSHTAWDMTRCHYGQPGDRLYIKEQHEFTCLRGGIGCLYKADGEERMVVAPYTPNLNRGRPSIHMPRWASRILLEVVSVRVERLTDISEADAIAEGAEWAACGSPQEGSHKAGFASLWESINGAGSWSANPWVWAIEFKRRVE